MRADRLLSILMTLQLRRQVTASELSRQLEVSVRTIYRDLDALGQSGVPVYADRGRNGGVRLAEGYQTKLTGLSAEEAQALPFAGVSVAAAALGFGRRAEAARLKVLAALPSASREKAYIASERFYLDPADWYRRSATPRYLQLISAAVWAGQAVEMDYESWNGRRKHVVEPLGLVLKAGAWYLLGRRHMPRRRGMPHRARAKQVSIYRVESIRGVQVLSQMFKQPRNFDLASAWRKEIARFEASLKRMKAKIRVANSAMSRVDRLGADAAEAIHMAKADQGRWREATIWIESIDHAAGLLLGFGSEMEVLAPEELRRELAKRAAGVCAVYGSGGAGTTGEHRS